MTAESTRKDAPRPAWCPIRRGRDLQDLGLLDDTGVYLLVCRRRRIGYPEQSRTSVASRAWGLPPRRLCVQNIFAQFSLLGWHFVNRWLTIEHSSFVQRPSL